MLYTTCGGGGRTGLWITCGGGGGECGCVGDLVACLCCVGGEGCGELSSIGSGEEDGDSGASSW